MDLGDRIKGYRVMAGHTQEGFANLMDVSVPTVRNWEKGSQSPRLDELFLMAEIFNIPSDKLIYGEQQAVAVA